MPKLPRVTAKIFAGNAAENDLGQFGSALSGTKITNNDISVLQELPAYEEGWRGAVISNRNYPTLQEMNSVQRIASQQIAYTLQNGMPEWDGNTTYYTNQFCRVGKDFYYSKLDNNIGNNPVTSPDEWDLWSSGGTGGTSRNVGETVFSLLPLTDAGLHLLDGTLIEGLGSYRAFVQYIASLYGTGETHPSYFVTEEEWQQSVTKYGVCAKFVYNSTANTVRLPKVTGIVEGTLDINALGDLVEAGLPSLELSTATNGDHAHNRGTQEITGTLFGENPGSNQIESSYSGAFYLDKSTTNNHAGLANTDKDNYLSRFQASRSWTGSTSLNGAHTHYINVGNSIVGTTNTVQPQTIKGFMYLVIANSVKTDIEIDIDNVMTDLNGKADTDLSNLTPQGEKHLEKHFLNYNQITNCIKELPNRLDLSINGDRKLVVHSGSIYIVPYGTEAPTYAIGDFLLGEENNNNFKIIDLQYNSADSNPKLFYWVEVQNDYAVAVGTPKSVLAKITPALTGNNNFAFVSVPANEFSTPTAPTVSIKDNIWYDTTSNYIKITGNTGTTWGGVFALPIGYGYFNATSGLDYIPQAFNGLGAFSQVMWSDKGVKVSIPDGENNFELVTDKLTITDLAGQASDFIFIDKNGGFSGWGIQQYYEQKTPPTVSSGGNCRWFDTINKEQKITTDGGINWTKVEQANIGTMSKTDVNGSISAFSPKAPLLLADTESLDGNFVYKIQNLFNQITFAPNESKTFSIADYLPNDGHIYEVHLSSYIRTGNVSGNATSSKVSSDIIPASSSALRVCRCTTRTTSSQTASGTAIIPVGSKRFLTFTNIDGIGTSGDCGAFLYGYRKIR